MHPCNDSQRGGRTERLVDGGGDSFGDRADEEGCPLVDEAKQHGYDKRRHCTAYGSSLTPIILMSVCQSLS